MKCTLMTLTFSLLAMNCLAQHNLKLETTFEGVTYTALAQRATQEEILIHKSASRIVLSASNSDKKGAIYPLMEIIYEMWCYEDRIAIIGRANRYDAVVVFNRITLEPVDHFIAPRCTRSPSGRYIAFNQLLRLWPDLPLVNTDIAALYDLTRPPQLNRIVHEPYRFDIVSGIPFYPRAIAETADFDTPNPTDVTYFEFNWDDKEDILVLLAKSFEPEIASIAWIDFRTSSTTVYHKTINLEAEAAKHQLKVKREDGLSGLNVTKVSTPKREEALIKLNFKGGELDLLLTPEAADEVWDVPLP